jgi:hypothetical protein
MPAKILLFSALLGLLIPASVLACGVYDLNGVVRAGSAGYRIVTGEGSKSETVFSVSAAEVAKLFPYKNAPVTVSAVITKKFDGTRAQVAHIDQIQIRVPDPLSGALDTNYTLKEKRDCAK